MANRDFFCLGQQTKSAKNEHQQSLYFQSSHILICHLAKS